MSSVPRNDDAGTDLESRLTDDDHLGLRLWLRLLSCTLMIEDEIRARLRQVFGTTLPRFDLMAQLERFPQGLRMSELSKRLMVSQGNITGLTDMLERDGWVAREADPRDRRIFAVKPTPLGLQQFRRMASEHEAWITELLGGLSERERDTMLKLLQKLKNHLRETLDNRGGP